MTLITGQQQASPGSLSKCGISSMNTRRKRKWRSYPPWLVGRCVRSPLTTSLAHRGTRNDCAGRELGIWRAGCSSQRSGWCAGPATTRRRRRSPRGRYQLLTVRSARDGIDWGRLDQCEPEVFEVLREVVEALAITIEP